MKKLFLFCFAAGLSCVVSAQKLHFLYLQTDDLSPFYVKMGDKIYSSSTSGYLIVPNLVDSTYTLGIGFPRSTKPETRFAVTMNQNDRGYLVKNFAEGLSLFDMQDLSIVKSATAANQNTVYETKTDKFSAVLSKAANDPSLLKVPVAKKEEVKPKPEEKKEEIITVKQEEKPVETIPLKDTVVAKPVETVQVMPEPKQQEPVKTEPVVAQNTTTEEVKKPTVVEEPTQAVLAEAAVYKPSTVLRRSESSTTEGFGIVFIDKAETYADTIRILIPPSKYKLEDLATPVNLTETEKKTETAVAVIEPSKTEPKPEQPLADTVIVKEQTETKEPVQAAAAVATNTNCKQSASDKDFMKLRKNMASEETDEAMIDEARKVFKNRCFTVEQLRYLSSLFLTSAAKYQFFDAAYNHVSDKQNFTSLQSEIKDEYYLKRFKALIGG